MEDNIKLSKRLQCVAEMVKKGARVADIGTDHGFVPIYLIKSARAEHVIAMDIGKGPLESAREHIKAYNLTPFIETRLSDGTKELMVNEADTVIIAGMGGELIINILEMGKKLHGNIKEWILSPQSEPYKVRHYLGDNGFTISDEKMVIDDGKYYVIIKAVRGDMEYLKEVHYQYGKLLMDRKDEVLKSFLKHEKNTLQSIEKTLEMQKSDKARVRLLHIRKKITDIEEVEHEMQ